MVHLKHEERAVFCIRSGIWCTQWHKMKQYMNIYKDISMLFTFSLFLGCLGGLLGLSAQFHLQVLAGEVWMFASQVCTFSCLIGASVLFSQNLKSVSVKSAGFPSWAFTFSYSLNYCWYGFLKAANDKSFLWLEHLVQTVGSWWTHSVSS